MPDPTPTHFRKKPVVIRAEQYHSHRTLSSDFAGAAADGTFRYTEEGTLLIRTLEGTMEARDGDWIIRGIKGECYPCKPDIFAATYEPATPQPATPEVVEALKDMLAGWRYIRHAHGDLYGVGWDRVQNAAEAALTRAEAASPMCRVKIRDVQDGLIPSEKIVKIDTVDGTEEVAVSGTFVQNDQLRVAFIGRNENKILIELPVETTSGRRRVWVAQADVPLERQE